MTITTSDKTVISAFKKNGAFYVTKKASEKDKPQKLYSVPLDSLPEKNRNGENIIKAFQGACDTVHVIFVDHSVNIIEQSKTNYNNYDYHKTFYKEQVESLGDDGLQKAHDEVIINVAKRELGIR